jgi:hypothetical protein
MQQARDSNDGRSTRKGTRHRPDGWESVGDRAEKTVEVVQNHEDGTRSVAMAGHRPKAGQTAGSRRSGAGRWRGDRGWRRSDAVPSAIRDPSRATARASAPRTDWNTDGRRPGREERVSNDVSLGTRPQGDSETTCEQRRPGGSRNRRLRREPWSFGATLEDQTGDGQGRGGSGEGQPAAAVAPRAHLIRRIFDGRTPGP